MTYSLIRIKRVWHYRFQVNGVRIQRSTRETMRNRADPIASRAYEAAVFSARSALPVPTLSKLIDHWMEIHRPVSSLAHVSSVERFQRLHLYELSEKLISHVTTEDVERARNTHLLDHAPESVNHWLRILKLLFMWAVRREMIAQRPWSVAMQKVQKKPRSILPVSSAKRWLSIIDAQNIKTPTISTAVRLMLGLGLRESEASGARWEWIDWERRTYTPGVTKGKESQPLPAPDWLLEWLRPQASSAGLIAPKTEGQAYKSGYARKSMIAANAGIGLEGLTPHRLRGTFATLMSEQGVPIQTIQRVMRHKSPITTMAYLETNLHTAIVAQKIIAEKMHLTGEEMASDSA